MKKVRIDTVLLLLIAALVLSGALIFASAAFGLLAREAAHISSVAFNHLLLGVGLGLLLFAIASRIPYALWRAWAPYLFVFAVVLTAAVFIPHIGFEHGGGRRWLSILGFSFQPSELLKLAAVVFASAYCAGMKSRIATSTHGLIGFLGIISAPSIVLLLQPDLGTLGVICISTASIFWAAGIRYRDIFIALLIGLVLFSALVYFRPYVRDRVETFLNPTQGQQQESYQIRQSLIAIGSGGIFGRGFGQGIQKFTYLPEPMGDSIFAVAGEELGFAGTTALVLLYLLFALRGFHIASRNSDDFARFAAVGISTYLVIEAYINIAAMLGIAPLTGIPLTFISQGGSAMLISLLSAGVLLSISRSRGQSSG